MAGFDNDVVFGNNVDFTGNAAVSGQMVNKGELLIGADTDPKIRVGTITPGIGIDIDNGDGSITINVTGGGFSWTEITTTPSALTADTGHYINTGALCELTLPAAPVDDAIIKIVGVGAGGWIINCGAGEQIIYGVLSSIVGAGGSLNSSHRRDCVTLKYIGSGVWEGIDSEGNLGVQ